MSTNRLYLAIGEEAARGAKESGTVGFVPLLNPAIPKMEFDDRRRKEFRGEESVKGDAAIVRMGQRWSASIETPFYTEAGSSKGIMGTLLKHFFGRSSSIQNGATGQYCHMMSPASDPFSEANVGGKGLTLNLNINEGAAVKNWPYTGGRVKSLSFEQEAGSALKLTAELIGQKREDAEAEIGNAEFSAEPLRCDCKGLSIYTGPVNRTGVAPDFTAFSFEGATRIRPDKVSVKMENGLEDSMRLSGVDYPDRSRAGQYKVTAEVTIDWEDPASGFSSVAEFRSWLASAGSTNLFFHWDTGAQAGTGDNHALFIDLPRLVRAGGEPEYKHDKEPVVTLRYEGLYDASTGYMAAVMLVNTAPLV
ncbi:MAG: hypothetical protein IT362_04145 [Deltaproteobacteria bacterium]|nr:hypothetical protein [Deltaproteobacteria bacterium]